MYSCLVDDSGFREQICLGTLLFPFVGGNWRVPNKELDFSEMCCVLLFHFICGKLLVEICMSQTPEITSWQVKSSGKFFQKKIDGEFVLWGQGKPIARLQIVHLNTCSTSTTSSDMLGHPIQNHLGPLGTCTSKKYLLPATGCSLRIS